MRRTILIALLLAGCGGARPPVSTSSPDDDHWETAVDHRLVYVERCGTGPFEVRFPARAIEWGRRVTVETYGAHRLSLRYELEVVREDGAASTVLSESFGDDARPVHERCRGASEESAALGPGSDGAGSSARLSVDGETITSSDHDEAELAPMPVLTPFRGELPPAIVGAASALFPRGRPERRGTYDEIGSEWGSRDRDAGGEIRIRVWLLAPSDFDGVVLRFRDQTLVPDLPLAEYEARFAERVAITEQRSRARAAGRRSDDASRAAFCARYRCAEPVAGPPGHPPPAPIAEVQPRAPSPEVDWVSGFWSWDAPSRDYVWVAGTFVSRARAARDAPPSALPSPSARELEAAIPPRPAPRDETIPSPIAGAVWVAGHWQLEGTRWTWSAGAWLQPPSSGARPIAPSIRDRDGVRIYVPGGWIHVR